MITGYKPSKHLLRDREERYIQVATKVGIGEIYAIFPHPENEKREIVMTTTGVVMIAERKCIITLYAADIKLAIALYKGELPNALRTVIKHNMKCYPELW